MQSFDRFFIPFNSKWKSAFVWNYHNAFRDLEPLVKFKKREKHPWRSATFGKVAGNIKLQE